MKYRYLTLFVLISTALWLLSFLSRIFIVKLPEIENIPDNQNVTYDAINLLYNNDKFSAFVLIFKTNLKACVFNISGGAMFGIGTIINLIYNGFMMADTFLLIYGSGTNFSIIFKRTIPHSFELIGLWLSGGMGLYIAYNILFLMEGKRSFTRQFYSVIGIGCVVTFIIILSAAYVETYISSTL
jgi:uncharacterized membrane protein SpoIIM required for sporulation